MVLFFARHIRCLLFGLIRSNARLRKNPFPARARLSYFFQKVVHIISQKYPTQTCTPHNHSLHSHTTPLRLTSNPGAKRFSKHLDQATLRLGKIADQSPTNNLFTVFIRHDSHMRKTLLRFADNLYLRWMAEWRCWQAARYRASTMSFPPSRTKPRFILDTTHEPMA